MIPKALRALVANSRFRYACYLRNSETVSGLTSLSCFVHSNLQKLDPAFQAKVAVGSGLVLSP